MHRPTHLLNIQTVRDRARKHIELALHGDGDRGSERDTTVRLLNEALVSEIVCALRYRRHYFMARDAKSDFAAAVFLEHARKAQEHADAIASHVVRLGGELDFSPEGLPGHDYAGDVDSDEMLDWIREDLAAKHAAIETYGEILHYLGRGSSDAETRALLTRLLATAREHAGDMQRWLEGASRFVERRAVPSLRRVAGSGLETAESA